MKVLLTNVAQCHKRKEKEFEVFTAATEDELDALWSSLLAVYKAFRLRYMDSISAKDVTPHLAGSIFTHCGRQRHCFAILKCGESECSICKPPCLPSMEFVKLGHIPDPMPATDDHYHPFAEVFKKKTTEENRPSA